MNARTRDPVRALVYRLTVATLAVLLVMAGLASWAALDRFERVFAPELERKAHTVGEVLAAQINRALGFGIPLDRLPGIHDALEAEIGAHADIAYAAVTDADGRVIAAAGRPAAVGDRLSATAGSEVYPGFVDVAVPLGDADGTAEARLHVGVDRAYLAKASVDLMLDVLSVLLVSVLLTFEVLLVVVNLAMRRTTARLRLIELAEAGDFRGDPAVALRAHAAILAGVNARFAELSRRAAAAGGRAAAEAAERLHALGRRFVFRTPGTPPVPSANLVYLRLPVFLFCLSEELSRPFLPAYARSFASSAPWLTPDMVVGLPITLFMLVWALSQPSGAAWSERWGRRRAFVAGALLGSVSLAMTAFAATLWDLLLWRCLTALGYGLVLITAQGIVIDRTTRDNRAMGMAMFIGGLLAAGVCGPLTGGIIADQVGPRATFLVGAALALVSGIAIVAAFGRTERTPEAAPVRLSLVGSAAVLARTPRFAILMLLSAIPTKIAATGVLFCLVPLMLAADGASKAEVGRAQMMYFVAFILVSPLAAALSDRWQARREFVALGGLGTLLSAVPLLMSHGAWAAPAAVALFGLSQAFIGAPQLTLVSQVARDAGIAETAAIGWFRMFERMGGAIGPMVAVALSVLYSYREAMVAVSLLCGAAAVLFWLAFRPRPPRPHPHVQEA
ncbi:MFS transporter [Azospirillum halopraeferens]|uniref:MFS transporter n=1 Tax=Azospirillum halopraeferens TaxID=34010 RepID=UPI0003FC9865|nr:MFS transporter [Azospirillum halopraeferens]